MMRQQEKLCHLWDTWEESRWEISTREPNLLCLKRKKPSELLQLQCYEVNLAIDLNTIILWLKSAKTTQDMVGRMQGLILNHVL